MAVAIAIIAILLVAGATLLLTAGRRGATGSLSRETRRRDAGTARAATPSAEAEGRERAEETRAALEGGAGLPAVPEPATVAKWEPIDEEELGVTRRHFLNLGLLATVGFAVASFGAGVLAFLWPTGAGGFGSKVRAGKLADVLAEVDGKRAPFYVPEARAYITRYPVADVAKAEKAGYPSAVMAGLEEGVIALYQKCPHLGCRVPWCQTSQWFECPCHGSKYNRVGEKRDGPAPRGMSLFAVDTSGGDLVVDSSTPYAGLKIGTDTTGQKPEGPSCI